MYTITLLIYSADFYRATANTDSERPNRGGVVTISGYTVKIPDNLLVEFPALFVPFAEFATAGSGQWAGPNEVSVCTRSRSSSCTSLIP